MLHHNELITIEEDTILGSRCMQRRFTLQNKANKLSISVQSAGGSVCSCRLENGRHEIVLSSGPSLWKKDPEFYPLSSEWQAHVLGLDSLLLTTASQSLTYQLTTSNELHVVGKVRQSHSLAPFYMNLVSHESFCLIIGLNINSLCRTRRFFLSMATRYSFVVLLMYRSWLRETSSSIH